MSVRPYRLHLNGDIIECDPKHGPDENNVYPSAILSMCLPPDGVVCDLVVAKVDDLDIWIGDAKCLTR